MYSSQTIQCSGKLYDMTNTIDYFIDGKRVPPNGGSHCDSRNPATGEVIASVALDEISAADAAVEAVAPHAGQEI